MKIYKKKKRQIAGVMALIMVMSSLMGNMACIPVLAAEGEYPYMMFASSGDEGAITLTTNNVGINGNVATNGSIVTSSQNVNINGTRTENLGNPEAYIGMPDIGEALEAAYFSANTEVLSEDYSLEDTNININTPLEGEGSIELTGNITLNAGVMAEEDLVFSGEVKNTGDVVIYSATGDVVIESTNVNVNGLIYAPHGEIRINSMNLNMNNVILIAEKITIEANGINGGKNRAMAAFIGEDYAVIGDESGDDAGAGDNPSVSENEGENGNDPSVSDNEGNVSDNTASDNEADGTVSENEPAWSDRGYISINLDDFYYAEETYILSHLKTEISGTAVSANTIVSMELQILDSNGTLVYEGEIAPEDEWISETLGFVVGENHVTVSAVYEDGQAESVSVCILNLYEDNILNTMVDITDTDGDGLYNYYEDVLGLGKDLSDTDGDGLTDYEEIYYVGTKPDMPDSDGDGTRDDLEDEDGDGVLPREEMTYETRCQLSDSDGDSLSDGEEIWTYGTNPILYDTDEDGLSDGEEILLALNPLVADSDGDGILDAGESVFQSYAEEIDTENSAVTNVEVSFACPGNMERQTDIKDMYNIDVLSTGVVGLVGVPVSIETTAEFDTATITFFYDETLLGETDEGNLCMMWYDEENYCYRLLEDSVVDTDQNKVTYETTHFSTYLLVDRTLWEAAWEVEIDYTEISSVGDVTNQDIIVLLDMSVSQEEFQLEKEAFQSIIDNMQEGDRIKLGFYIWGQAYYHTGWETYSTTAEDYIRYMAEECAYFDRVNIYANIGEYNASMSWGLQTMYNAIENDLSDNERVLFVLCSGRTCDENQSFELRRARTAIENLEAMGVEVNLLSVNSSISNRLALFFENATGLSFVRNSSLALNTELTNYFIQRHDFSNADKEIDYTDGDNDGLPDVYERRGIRLINGSYLYCDDEDSDSDDDGLLDGEEMVRLDSIFPADLIPDELGDIYVMRSNPMEEDTDGDEIIDGVDCRRLENDNYAYKFVEFINAGYIDMEDMYQTEDGFTICMTPLSEIFRRLGFPANSLYTVGDGEDIDYSRDGNEYYLNDWFLYSVDGENQTSYSIIKLRENGEQDSGVSIPFVSIDVSIFTEYAGESTASVAKAELAQITNEAYTLGEDDIITNYFATPSSEALYLLPLLYATKVASEECENGYMTAIIENHEPDDFSMDTLEQYQYGTSAEYQIYNAETNTLYIEDVTDLTIPEMQCILACRTNNRSLNSFAGEIVYHAVIALETSPWDENTVLENMYYFHPLAGPLPTALETENHFLYKSAITADLNMGEINWFRLIFYDGPAFKWNISDYVVEQREIWGDM